MQRMIVGLALLCSPLVAQAQVEYQWADFVRTANGFTTTLKFRNINQYGDANIIGIGQSIVIRFSTPSLTTLCADFNTECRFSRTGVSLVGVQTGAILQAGGGGYRPALTQFTDCGINDCLPLRIGRDEPGDFFGCQMLAAPPLPFPLVVSESYLGRTCAADGYNGFIEYRLSFSVFPFSAAPLPTLPQFSVSDLSATFSERTYVGTVLVIAPEPGTWALMALGLVSLAAFRRKRAVT